MPQSGVGSMQGPQKVVFHQRLSSIEGCLPPKVIFHRRSSSTEGPLPAKVLFHRKSSSNEGRLPPQVVFHRRLSSIKGRLLPIKWNEMNKPTKQHIAAAPHHKNFESKQKLCCWLTKLYLMIWYLHSYLNALLILLQIMHSFLSPHLTVASPP